MHTVTALLYLLPGAVLLALAACDAAHRTLPNTWVAVYAALFLPFAWGHGLSWGALGAHALAGAVAFVILFILFLLKGMAGGDVKLGAAVFWWAGPALALPVVIIVAWTGGVLAVAGWLADRAWAQRLARRWALLRCVFSFLSARRGVPYGVALAAGGLFCLW